MTCDKKENKKFPKIKIFNFELNDYCSKCENKFKCNNFSFMSIMYSQVPTIVALTQLSLSKLDKNQFSDEEYKRLVNYNVKYITFLEELYMHYKRSLISVQLSQFTFSTPTCILIDEMFHIFIKWFEKLVFWNRVNSIKALPCTYYKELLCENTEFIFDLFIESVQKYKPTATKILQLQKVKEHFIEIITSTEQPKSNGDYFTHTEYIKDTLIIFLEFLLFSFLSLDRTQQEKEPYVYIVSSYFLIGEQLLQTVIRNIITIHSSTSKVNIKIVTKTPSVKTDLLLKTKELIGSEYRIHQV